MICCFADSWAFLFFHLIYLQTILAPSGRRAQHDVTILICGGCCRIARFIPEVFARSSPLGCSAEQSCYRNECVPQQIFAPDRLRRLVGERICYRSGLPAPKVFARSNPLGCPAEQICYRIDSVPIQFFAPWRLRELVGERICYRIACSIPEVFARYALPRSSAKQICYRMDNSFLQFFASRQLKQGA